MSTTHQENKRSNDESSAVCYLCSKRIYHKKYLHCKFCTRCAHIKCVHRHGTDMITCDSCRKRDTLSLVVL